MQLFQYFGQAFMQFFWTFRQVNCIQQLGASLLSFVPTYMTNDHHQKDGKCLEGKEPIDFVTRMEAMGVFRLSGGDLHERKRR